MLFRSEGFLSPLFGVVLRSKIAAALAAKATKDEVENLFSAFPSFPKSVLSLTNTPPLLYAPAPFLSSALSFFFGLPPFGAPPAPALGQDRSSLPLFFGKNTPCASGHHAQGALLYLPPSQRLFRDNNGSALCGGKVQIPVPVYVIPGILNP